MSRSTQPISRGPRRYAALGAAIAVVAIVAGVFLAGGLKQAGEGKPPELAVSVSGVPDYVVLGSAFVVTIEYENLGNSASGALSLSARLPDNFWLESSESRRLPFSAAP